MNFMLLLNVCLLAVVLILPLAMIIALLVPKKNSNRDSKYSPDRSNHNRSGLRKTVLNMLVMRPWPYKDLYNPLSRNYWPDELLNNRAGRRQQNHNRRKR